MKTLLDIYNKYIINDIGILNLDKLEEDFKNTWGDNWISCKYKYSGLITVSRLLSETSSSLQIIKKYPDRPYKAFYIPNRIFLLIRNDLYYDPFSLYSPLMMISLIDLYIEQFGEFPEDPNINLLGYGKELLLEVIRSQRYWGTWIGNSWKWDRKRRLIHRELEVIDLEYKNKGFYILIVTKDIKNKKIINLCPGSNYMVFLSKDLLKERLQELENKWMGEYDSKLRYLDLSINDIENKLKELQKEREIYSNEFENIKNKINDIIWKNF